MTDDDLANSIPGARSSAVASPDAAPGAPGVARTQPAAGIAPRAEEGTGARRGSLALGAGVFLVLAGVMTWPRLANLATSVVDHGDPLEDIWTLQWIGRTLLTDPARLYDAPIFYGFPRPLAYDDIGIGPALVTLPVTALTGNPVLAYNLLIVGSFALAGWCAFLLARHVTGSALAGLIAGMAYGFWSYTFAHLSHMSVLSLYPMPLALLCLHRLFAAADAAPAGKRMVRAPAGWAAGFALCFLWQALHSFYYAAYLALAAGGLVAWEALWCAAGGRGRVRCACKWGPPS